MGFNYGAKKYKRMWYTLWYSLAISTVTLVAGTLCFVLFTREILLLFHASDSLMYTGIPALRIISTSFPFFGLTILNAYPVPKHWLYSTEYNHNPVKRSFSACADRLGILAFWADIHMADISHIRKYCSFSNLLLYLCVVPGTTGLPASVPE